jgi:hypothetical protein
MHRPRAYLFEPRLRLWTFADRPVGKSDVALKNLCVLSQAAESLRAMK